MQHEDQWMGRPLSSYTKQELYDIVKFLVKAYEQARDRHWQEMDNLLHGGS